MHRSQLAGFIIDCEGEDVDAAADFWGRALGYEALPLTNTEEEKYRRLDTGPNGWHIEVQQVDHPSSVHIYIHSCTTQAEVQRLAALGEKRLERVKTWCVMEAPTGQRFCVIRSQREFFSATANEW